MCKFDFPANVYCTKIENAFVTNNETSKSVQSLPLESSKIHMV